MAKVDFVKNDGTELDLSKSKAEDLVEKPQDRKTLYQIEAKIVWTGRGK